MPDEPVPLLGEKQYEVVGRNVTLASATGEKHEVGTTLALNLTAEQEAFYVDGGHLKVVAAKGGGKGKEE